MSEIERIKKKILVKDPVIGTGVTFTDSSITELLGHVGFDFIWIDTEHTAIDKKDLLLHIIAAKAAGVAAFVRVPWNEPTLVKPVLEMGPAGIIFPMIKTAEEAEKAVRSCLYPPEGMRGYGPIRALGYGLKNRQEYIKEDSQVWKIMQIEHVDGVSNLEDILNVKGVDTIVVGPMDLSGSIGLLGQVEHDEVKKLMDTIAEKLAQSKKPLGISICYDPRTIEEWLDRGIRWMSVGNDFVSLAQYSQDVFKTATELFKRAVKRT